ncbi:hypothetical protein M0R45_019735 [Rubus argutus]|uniref:Uncharacterized protein n=1 Tax=Rubus argutus TaxID=59490 RepID=A0AAW1X7U1_RUBAR
MVPFPLKPSMSLYDRGLRIVAGIEQRRWWVGETQTRPSGLRDGDGAKGDGRQRRRRADRGTSSFKHGLLEQSNLGSCLCLDFGMRFDLQRGNPVLCSSLF